MVRILVADDYADWRSKIREILNHSPHCQIVDEACDGGEAVEKAAQLQPAIVILDLSMACLNGLEAAKLIRQRSPSTGIVFLSANLDANIQQAALNIGHAFVLKSRATDDLLPAVEKVHAAAASEREDSGSLSART